LLQYKVYNFINTTNINLATKMQLQKKALMGRLEFNKHHLLGSHTHKLLREIISFDLKLKNRYYHASMNIANMNYRCGKYLMFFPKRRKHKYL